MHQATRRRSSNAQCLAVSVLAGVCIVAGGCAGGSGGQRGGVAASEQPDAAAREGGAGRALPVSAEWDSEAAIATPVQLMVGSFSSQAQAAEGTDFLDIRLRMVEIWKDSRVRGERWLYVEQAMASALEKPYRQRVYRVTGRHDRGEDGTLVPRISSEVFELPGDPLAMAGAWREPGRFGAMSPKDLLARAGCTVVLTRTNTTGQALRYEGGTSGTGCASTLRGAAYATSEVVLTREGLETLDRGFDAAGTQVWGSQKRAYRFLRVAE